MDVIQKELESRRTEIKKEVELLFKANMKITDWDVPEPDDNEAAKLLLKIFQEVVGEIESDVDAGKYDNY